MDYQQAQTLLSERGQLHLLDGWKTLSESEQTELLKQIEAIDWTVFRASDIERTGLIEPLPGLSLKEIKQQEEEFYRIGAGLIRGGKLATVMLAGGQGTRLGAEIPKGMYDIGITRSVYIFERLIRNLLHTLQPLNAFVPLYIMTSERNDAVTRAFLKEHNYFGYPEGLVSFFVQGMVPSTDFNGKILLEDRGKLALSPNGNGGWFSSLMRTRLAQEIQGKGIEWLNVFAVDNVLQHIADPVFLGATAKSGMPCGAKTVKKSSPEERVGVLCKRGGMPDVIEYYELDEITANRRDGDGNLLYADGVILNYLFKISRLNEIASQKIPVHRAKKKVVCFNGKERVFPEKENAYKYETLILDMIRLMSGCLSFEVEREREFAPVKNATGTDSVLTARELLQKNGVEL